MLAKIREENILASNKVKNILDEYENDLKNSSFSSFKRWRGYPASIKEFSVQDQLAVLENHGKHKPNSRTGKAVKAALAKHDDHSI